MVYYLTCDWYCSQTLSIICDVVQKAIDVWMWTLLDTTDILSKVNQFSRASTRLYSINRSLFLYRFSFFFWHFLVFAGYFRLLLFTLSRGNGYWTTGTTASTRLSTINIILFLYLMNFMNLFIDNKSLKSYRFSFFFWHFLVFAGHFRLRLFTFSRGNGYWTTSGHTQR